MGNTFDKKTINYVYKHDGNTTLMDYLGHRLENTTIEKIHKFIAKNEKHIDFNIQNKFGDTLLMIAFANGDRRYGDKKYGDIIQLILSNKTVNVNLCNKKGYSALYNGAALDLKYYDAIIKHPTYDDKTVDYKKLAQFFIETHRCTLALAIIKDKKFVLNNYDDAFYIACSEKDDDFAMYIYETYYKSRKFASTDYLFLLSCLNHMYKSNETNKIIRDDMKINLTENEIQSIDLLANKYTLERTRYKKSRKDSEYIQ
ncbi:MAG: hypothetical protein Faunusvirus57_1 [Faunusvirus sp.]|uniref:Ankyrin repeat protein n=1 Tax=Faunusvirus sp. TaxID=2487766 RepID=A0A3G5A1T0_9VIRU|nr:MAG: hypothetical protein Faunusvirus57_1 [Faunusvirus sp.]